MIPLIDLVLVWSGYTYNDFIPYYLIPVYGTAQEDLPLVQSCRMSVMDLPHTQRVKPTNQVGEILKHEMVQMMSLGDTSQQGAIKKAIDQFTGGKGTTLVNKPLPPTFTTRQWEDEQSWTR